MQTPALAMAETVGVVPMPAMPMPALGGEQEPSTGVDELVCKLIDLAEQAKALELLSHLVHLNYEGAQFLSVHEFLKGRYETHLQQFDGLAEFVRTLDYLVPVCLNCGLEKLSCPLPELEAGSERHLLAYLKNLEAFGMAAKELVEVARSAEAPDVENYGADLVADSFKAAWFIKSLLR
jgi:DNA-binding ferritin-like protein